MRDRIRDTLTSFFIIVTLINVAMFVLGLIFSPEQRFGYEIFIYPVLYGALASIPGLVLSSGKEMSLGQAVVQEVIRLALIITILLIFMFGGRQFTTELFITALAVSLSIVIVYAGVMLIRWRLDTRTAARMTEDLMTWKKNSEGDAYQ